MVKLTKRVVDATQARDGDYVIWDDELPGFGLRVFTSGKRSYVLQYRSLGRSRRYTIGLHGVWTAESARQEAKIQLGRVDTVRPPATMPRRRSRSLAVKSHPTMTRPAKSRSELILLRKMEIHRVEFRFQP
ncbi:MAG: Arm DNA-binding domain-containing protein [Rhizomicrobium sp.]|nr:Arm DNA-binding domain-containing protein [Rhizomicrobium sp.]